MAGDFHQLVCAASKASDQPVHTRNMIKAFANGFNILIVLQTEHHLEFLSLKRDCMDARLTC